MADHDSLEVLLSGLTFPESPRWHNNQLWFSDFYSERVMTLDAAGQAATVVNVPGRPSGLGWDDSGALLVVSMLEQRLMRFDPHHPEAGLRQAANLSVHATGPSNDMVVDGQGRAFIGNFGFDLYGGEAQRTACLQRVDPDGSVHKVAQEIVFPNGMVISPDGATLIVAETLAHRLTAFDITPEGNLENRRVFAQLEGRFPDGICLDAEGAVWVADARGHVVQRVLAGGRVERTVSTGERFAIACMLGGSDRNTLFVCTNTDRGPVCGDLKAGRIESILVEVPGAGYP